MSDEPLEMHDVQLTLAGRIVLDDVELECPAGQVTALLGPNGAGKSSTLALGAGLRSADRGTVTVAGRDARDSRARQLSALIPQEISFPAAVTVERLLDFVERQREPTHLAPSREELCDRLGLTTLLARRIGGLSGGQQRKVAVALGFVRAPQLLMLDEATTNLDESARATTWALVAGYAARGGAALVTSHIIADIELHAHRIVVLEGGRVALSGSVADVRDRLGASTVSIRIAPRLRTRVLAAITAASLADVVDEGAEDALSWRTSDPLALVAHLAVVAPEATHLVVAPTPLGAVLRDVTHEVASC